MEYLDFNFPLKKHSQSFLPFHFLLYFYRRERSLFCFRISDEPQRRFCNAEKTPMSLSEGFAARKKRR